MKVSERVALKERLARSIVWHSQSDELRESARAQASALVDELESGYRESMEVGWMFLDPEPEDAEK